jgi:hypothetical protein
LLVAYELTVELTVSESVDTKDSRVLVGKIVGWIVAGVLRVVRVEVVDWGVEGTAGVAAGVGSGCA